MLEKLLKMYRAAMLYDVRSPMPHLAGPPGVGKSETVEQLAQIVGKKLHVLSVARISPLEVEGVQMPVDGNTRLQLLHNTLWTQLEEGDIVLCDEFLRGFPEVYNAILDIMTSRCVAGLKLPKVFFVGASNSVAAYDPALTDRLLHLLVPDLRKVANTPSMRRMVEELGLHPDMATTTEMQTVFTKEIHPTYAVLDQFTGKSAPGSAPTNGKSMRNLVGQVRLREVDSWAMKDLINTNNKRALMTSKYQYVVLLSGANPDPEYVRAAKQLDGSPKLTPVQQRNLTMNLELIEMHEALVGTPTNDATGKESDDDTFE